MCYAGTIPVLVWAILLMAGVDADTTRVPYLIAQFVGLALTIHGLRKKDRLPRKSPRPGHE